MGKHLGKVARDTTWLRGAGVALTAEIERLLQEPAYAVAIPEERRGEAVKELVANFHQESSFQTAENGELEAVLDGSAVREAALALLAGSG